MTQPLHNSRWFIVFSLLAISLIVAWVRLTPLNLPSLEKRAQQLAIIETAEQIYANSNQSINQGIDPKVIQAISDQKHLWEKRSDELAEDLKAQRQYINKDGSSHTFISAYDSYHWLRLARNVLEKGTHCDEGSFETCRNTHSLAPVGHAQDYLALPHIYSIVGMHKFTTYFEENYPLAASANCLSLLLAVLIILPAFFIGKQLSGIWGGLSVGLIVSLGSSFLSRTFGVDTDVWNSLLLLLMIWLTMSCLRAEKQSQRIFWIVLCGLVTGLWAHIWSGWVLGYLIILCSLIFHLIVGVVQKHKTLTGDLLILLVYLVSCGLATQLGPADINYFQLPLEIYQQLIDTTDVEVTQLNWPDHLKSVAEWQNVGLLGLYMSMGGQFQFLLALSGCLLLLANTRKDHQSFKVLALCLFSYNILLFWLPDQKILAFILLAIPLLISLLYHLYQQDSADLHRISIPGLLIIAVLACLWLGYDATRFLLFSWPIMAILLGTSISLCSQWLWSWLKLRNAKPAFLLLPFLLFSGLTIKTILPGIAFSQTFIPPLNRSYHQTFSELFKQSAENAIITGLWEYGYWLQYYADRRTSTDGGTLLNRANYWVNRAYTRENEREAIGILRMLNCSSDASNVVEGQFSAIERLKAAGLTEEQAFKLILQLVRLDKSGAERLISQNSELTTGSEHILQATHCIPPESILITSTEQIVKTPSWVSAGIADPLDPKFNIGPIDQYKVIPRWQGCNSSDVSIPDLACPILQGAIQSNKQPDLFIINFSEPASARFHPGEENGLSGTPGVILIANDEKLDHIEPDNPELPEQGVLVDRKTNQVLIGKAVVLKSIYAQLQFLDGRYSQFFEPLIKHADVHGDSVIAWRVKRWE